MAASPPSFAARYGFLLIASIINAVLYGIALLMGLQYFRWFSSRDILKTKLTVILLLLFNTSQMVFLSHDIYDNFINKFGRLDLLDEIPFSAVAQLLAIYLTAFTAQIFFSTRIWLLLQGYKKYVFTLPVVILALLQISSGIAQAVLVTKTGHYSLLKSTTRVTSTQSASAAACDILITVFLCVIFNASRSGVRKTDNVIDKLILYAINRGAVTSLAALLNFALFVGFPGSFYFMIPIQASCHLYVISVTSMLSDREGLRNKLYASTGADSFPLSSISWNAPQMSHTTQDTHPGQNVINIQRTVVSFPDHTDPSEKDQSTREVV